MTQGWVQTDYDNLFQKLSQINIADDGTINKYFIETALYELRDLDLIKDYQKLKDDRIHVRVLTKYNVIVGASEYLTTWASTLSGQAGQYGSVFQQFNANLQMALKTLYDQVGEAVRSSVKAYSARTYQVPSVRIAGATFKLHPIVSIQGAWCNGTGEACLEPLLKFMHLIPADLISAYVNYHIGNALTLFAYKESDIGLYQTLITRDSLKRTITRIGHLYRTIFLHTQRALVEFSNGQKDEMVANCQACLTALQEARVEKREFYRAMHKDIITTVDWYYDDHALTSISDDVFFYPPINGS